MPPADPPGYVHRTHRTANAAAGHEHSPTLAPDEVQLVEEHSASW